ncbi:MAG: PHP domain-containing protein [Peptococcaceae bacterium]|nr:PHP domain-containing protein [Peptococcaceae bacterium]
MIKVRCDLHIHTALSPCANREMTPTNIVNMATLVGANVIAITDHNSCRNARAVAEAAGQKLIVLPGLEVWTKEDVHMLCLFGNMAIAESFGADVYARLPARQGDSDLFGQQYFFDAGSRIIGWEEQLLLSPTTFGVDELCRAVLDLGGIVIPAHVDRTYGLATQLGFIPEHLPIRLIEVSKGRKQPASTRSYPYITNSDAHNLSVLAANVPWELEIEKCSPEGVVKALKEKYPYE